MAHKFVVRDDVASETLDCSTMEEAIDFAREWLEDGDWDRSTTLFLDAHITEYDEDGNEVDVLPVEVTLPAEEPPCVDGDPHDWQSPWEIVGGLRENPGVWGSGGGVRITEVCMRCGCGKHTDTWASNPTTGQQGYRTVEYHPGEFRESM